MDEQTTEIKIERIDPAAAGGPLTFAISGEIDLAVADELTEAIEPAASAGSQPLVIDLVGTSFIDSSGIRVLLKAHRLLAEAGEQCALVLAPGSVAERTLELTGVTDAFPTFPSREAAVAELTP